MIWMSIVSGTYNRITHLKRMVDSIRFSIGKGIPYEIILVDGGSTDGTQAWCKTQPDIVLIEQGKLLGAVKAFNAGFAKAKGKYVVIGNDDIIYINETLRTALSFMERHTTVGVGCFYQDRHQKDWHVEYMQAVKANRTITVPYGQVCIVLKEIGDKAGWWGTEYHTYGGDNELSCNVLEMGYEVIPIDGCCIHDLALEDNLRKINKGSNLQTSLHPDSAKWLAKWHSNGRIGPVIPRLSRTRLEFPTTRVLYAPIYEPGHSIAKTSKCGLRDALSRRCLVTEVDYLQNPDYVFDVACAFQPDVFLFQIQDSNNFGVNSLRELRKLYAKSKFINWNGDYHPETLYSPEYMELMKSFDLALFVSGDVVEHYKATGINSRYWQVSWEPTDALPTSMTPRLDVVFMGNEYSAARTKLGNTLMSLPKLKVGFYGKWTTQRSLGNTLYDFDAGNRIYCNSLMTVSDAQWDKAKGYVSNRLFQALHAGVMVLQQRIPEMEYYLGLESGIHLVTWDTWEDLAQKIQYYHSHPTERAKIAKAGKEFVDAYHSFDCRVTELAKYVELNADL